MILPKLTLLAWSRKSPGQYSTEYHYVLTVVHKPFLRKPRVRRFIGQHTTWNTFPGFNPVSAKWSLALSCLAKQADWESKYGAISDDDV